MRKIIFIITVCSVMIALLAFPSSAVVPLFTNFADRNSAEWLYDHRLTSGGGTGSLEGYMVTNYVSVSQGDVVRVKGIDITSGTYSRIGLYNSSKSDLYVSSLAGATSYLENIVFYSDSFEFTVSTDVVKFIRFCCVTNDTEVIITRNEEIAYGSDPVEPSPDPEISVQIHGTRSQRLTNYVNAVEAGSCTEYRNTMSDSFREVFSGVLPAVGSVAVWIADRVEADFIVYMMVLALLYLVVGGKRRAHEN